MKYTYIILIGLLIGCSDHDNSSVTDQTPGIVNDDEVNIDENKGFTDTLTLTPEERIIQIKSWYKEMMSLKTKSNECVTDTIITMEKAFEEMDEIEFEQVGRACNLENGFSYLEGEFYGYEWATTTTFYYKNNQLFFAYSRGGAEACAFEYRLYYDMNGEVLRITEKTNDCDGEIPNIFRDITGIEEGHNWIKTIEGDLSEIESILGGE